MHQGEIPVLKAVDTYADSMGIQYQRSPDATLLLNEGDVVEGEYSAGSPVHARTFACQYLLL